MSSTVPESQVPESQAEIAVRQAELAEATANVNANKEVAAWPTDQE